MLVIPHRKENVMDITTEEYLASYNDLVNTAKQNLTTLRIETELYCERFSRVEQRSAEQINKVTRIVLLYALENPTSATENRVNTKRNRIYSNSPSGVYCEVTFSFVVDEAPSETKGLFSSGTMSVESLIRLHYQLVNRLKELNLLTREYSLYEEILTQETASKMLSCMAIAERFSDNNRETYTYQEQRDDILNDLMDLEMNIDVLIYDINDEIKGEK